MILKNVVGISQTSAMANVLTSRTMRKIAEAAKMLVILIKSVITVNAYVMGQNQMNVTVSVLTSRAISKIAEAVEISVIVIDNFVVGETRSPNTDTDYAGYGVSVNNQIVGVGHNFLGDISDNTQNPYSQMMGPIPVPDDPNTQVVFAYLIINLGLIADESPNTNYGAIDLATKDLMNSYVPGSGSPLAFVDNYLGYLYNSYCDGAVAVAKITTNGHDLAQRVAIGTSLPEQQDYFAGTDSRIGCGSNSRYYVRRHVKRVS